MMMMSLGAVLQGFIIAIIATGTLMMARHLWRLRWES
jgi:hypothetical protein